uniref:Protein FAM189A2-like n=1 Tax=Sinocyclocheilus anshuiensis TaxID=1608454 RepID=A0A671L8I0_9TELE
MFKTFVLLFEKTDTFCQNSLNRKMFGDGMIPLPHIYGARIKGVEVFCPLDPPPPYEAVASNPNTEVQMTDLTEVLTESAEAETPSDGMNQEQY